LSTFQRSLVLRFPNLSARACAPFLIFLAPALSAAAQAQTAAPLTEQDAIVRALGDGAFGDRAAGEREAARAGVDAITRFDNPRASVSRGSLSGPGEDETEWEVEIVQPLDLAGRRGALKAAARSEAEAVDADLDWRAAERRAEARRAWAGCASAGARSEVHRGFVARLTEAERIVTARADAGDAAVYDVRRVRVEARSAEGQARLAEGELAAECATLSRLTGVAGARAAGAPQVPEPARRASADRADLIARERRLTAARETARAAARTRWPEVEVGLGWRRVETLGFEADGPQITVGATIPLFDRGSASLREARGRERSAAAELILARREVEAEIAAADARLRGAIAAVGAAGAARQDAARLGATAETAYQSGEIGVTELVDAYRAARDAELSIIELTERAVLAAIELELAQGGPNP
jgi:outer membrane protein TolC